MPADGDHRGGCHRNFFFSTGDKLLRPRHNGLGRPAMGFYDLGTLTLGRPAVGFYDLGTLNFGRPARDGYEHGGDVRTRPHSGAIHNILRLELGLG